MGPSPYLWFFHAKQRLLDPKNKSLWVPDITCHFVHGIQRDYKQNYLSLWVPALICVFCMQNSDFWSRITSLYVSLTSPLIVCTQNSVPSIRITNLYWSQPWSAVFACKRATFRPERQVSMCPRSHLSFCACKTAWLAPELLLSMSSRSHL